MVETAAILAPSVGAFLFFVNSVSIIILLKMKEAAKRVLDKTAKGIRVVSVLPSATEILCSIGGNHLLVGRSHEDNFPQSITHLPMLTDQLISRAWTSAAAVNAEVSCALNSGKSLYFLNAELLTELKPDLILTQDLCSVCAIDLAEVRLIASKMNPQPRVLSLDPQTLEDVLDDMIIVGEAVGMRDEAVVAKGRMEDRVRAAMAAADKVLDEWKGIETPQGKGRVKVAFIEWSDPIYVGGHWTPQLIFMAGGEHTLNPCGEGAPNSYVQVGGGGKSFPVSEDSVVASDPDLVIVCPCGLDLEMSRRETDRLMSHEWFRELRAVKNKRLLVVDGDAMFNRPGPRLVDALEWLTSVLHESGGHQSRAVRHAISLRPKDFPFFDYFEVVSRTEVENNTAKIERDAELALVAIEEAHTEGRNNYADPATGYTVFTEFGHKKRGKCCGNRCRHCPFGHYNVKEEDRNPKAVLKIVKPTLLRAVGKRRSMRGILKEVVKLPALPIEKEKEVVVDVMFWSGGKDSYLSLLLLEQSYLSELREGKIVLMTTFEGSTGEILHQCLSCRDVMNQAKAMGYDLLLVPLPDQGGKGVSNISYQDTVNNALKVLREEISTEVLKFDTSSNIRMRLIFGDLHVQEIRDWRESTFGGKGGLECIFPAFNLEYSILQRILWTATGTGPKAEVESIQLSVWTGSRDDESTWNLFAKGQTYDQQFVSSLPPAIDTMGENGEFHSHVLFKPKKL